MTSRFAIVVASLGALLATSACSKDRSERVAASYSSVTKPASSTPPRPPPSPAPSVGLDAIPVEEDYEERAASTISADNLQARLVELEKEMSL